MKLHLTVNHSLFQNTSPGLRTLKLLRKWLLTGTILFNLFVKSFLKLRQPWKVKLTVTAGRSTTRKGIGSSWISVLTVRQRQKALRQSQASQLKDSTGPSRSYSALVLLHISYSYPRQLKSILCFTVPRLNLFKAPLIRWKGFNCPLTSLMINR